MAPALYHYAPLHCLPFIVRTGALLPRDALRSLGFEEGHRRRGSRRRPEPRRFEGHVHLALQPYSRALQAELGGGFPHFEVAIAAGALDGLDYHLRVGREQGAGELLVAGRVPLREGAALRFFDEGDLLCARDVLIALGVSTYKVERDPALSYTQQPRYRRAVQEALRKALADGSPGPAPTAAGCG